ncbi:Calcium channel YVC1 [Verticillium dahliae VDG2]|nr:Calcium channel YVC1 [Verticillium dahliae VDG2]
MLVRRILPSLRPALRPKPRHAARHQSSKQTPSANPAKPANAPATTAAPSTAQKSRLDRILDRLPQRLQVHTAALRAAPVSHTIAFLALHEITAIVPLLAFFALFHYTALAPLEYLTSRSAAWVRDGAEKAERYFSRKGWFGFEAADRGAVAGAFARSGDAEAGDMRGQLEQWQRNDERYKVVVEVALAWAVTKALLPARIILSAWGTPGTVALWKKIIRRGR